VIQPTFRFAPSPNGRLHLGHAYSALLNADFAAQTGGRLLLRIEDIDIARSRPEFEAAIREDLAWLGLTFEAPVRRQSEHFDEYRAAAERMRKGGLIYPCFCSRKDLAGEVARREAQAGRALPRDPDGTPLYPETCRHLARAAVDAKVAAGEKPAWRIAIDRALQACPGPYRFEAFDPYGKTTWVAAQPERWGDAVIVRKDIPTSYHLSVVADDALAGVTHVVRGQDLEAATDLHVLLQAILGLPTPGYHHHALIRDMAGDKLSKSLGSESLADLRGMGRSAEDVRRALGFFRASSK
jgi:glutamyl-Q tRNA(Asp) synthetase